MATTTDPGPTVFVLFGATGDLAKRMVLPAFYQLAQQGLLPQQWLLVGNGRGDVAHEDFRAHFRESLTHSSIEPKPGEWEAFAERLFFAGGGFNSDDPGSLLDVIDAARRRLGADPQLVHYLAVPPVAFGELTSALGQHGLARGSRVVYEKPFGTSGDGFRELDRVVHSVLDEQQVYRIDHFLGKEATQDLHLLRFANGLFDATWNRRHIESVQIDVPETLDISDRAQFYDATGAVLDMLVTHLFQVAAEVAMEPPASLGAMDLQAAREKVIGCFRPLNPAEVVLGQFDGYRDVPGIDPRSTQDTFVAARLWIDTERWRDVPFYLRTGKRMAASAQRVSLILREPPGGPLSGRLPRDGNVLCFSLAGDGDIDLSLVTKKPGAGLDLDVAHANFSLAALPGADPLPPYVRLIHDVLIGDRSLFTRPDGLASVWQVAEPLLSALPEVQPYAPGSWGPAAARDLVSPGHWILGELGGSDQGGNHMLHPGFRWRLRWAVLAVVLAVVALIATAIVPLTAAAGPVRQQGSCLAAGQAKPVIVLVHGAWADTSSWNGEIAELRADGFDARAIANPLQGLTTDSQYVADYVKAIQGPVILVGHSYGGAVISQAAAGLANVKGLVYVDASAPAPGEANGSLAGATSVLKKLTPAQLYVTTAYPGAPAGAQELYLKENIFLSDFANSLPASQARLLWATQRGASTAAFTTPSTQAAWQTIPSWYFISTGDRIITPQSELSMAHRAHSHITLFHGGSHLTLISDPQAVTKVIMSAVCSLR